MRIVMVTESLGDAFGQERVVRDSTRLLLGAGHDVFFLTSEIKVGADSGGGAALIRGLFQLHTLSSPSKVHALHEQAMGAVRSFQPDIVHLIDTPDYRLVDALVDKHVTVFTAHTVSATCPAGTRFLPLAENPVCERAEGWPCLVENKRGGCLAGFKSDIHRAQVIQNFKARQKALRRTAGALAISRYTERLLLRSGWSADSVDFVPNPVTSPGTPRPPSPENYVLLAARLVPMKGIETALEAVKRSARDDWKLWICGDGPERARLEALATDRVRFLGRTDFATTARLFAESRAVLQTNVGPEGFGLSVAEGGLLEKTVIASRVPALDEIIDDRVTGILVPPRDAAALAREIDLVLEDPGLAESMGKRAREKIIREYGPERHLAATLEAYRRASSSGLRFSKARMGRES